MNQDELSRNSPLSPSSLVAAAAALPPEAINLYAGLLSAPTGSPINMLTPQLFAANQLLAARLNSTAANFYTHSLFPWQMPPIANSPPISPISPVLNVKKTNNNNNNHNNNNNIVTTTTSNSKNATALPMDDDNDLEINQNHLNDIGKLAHGNKTAKKANTRKSTNCRKKRNQILYQPYTNLETMASGAISPGPLSPPTSGLSGSSPQSIGSLEHQSSSPNKEAATTITTATSTNGRDKSFTCQTCNRSFGYKHVLQNHERTHTGEKPFACLECDKRFTRDHHLKTHMRLHTGEKPYACDHCDRKFVQVANLRRHLRVHTGEKPYACQRCDAKYSDSNQLKTHMIAHKDEKPFQCGTCNASFRRSHHLANHKCANAPLTPATSPVISMECKSIASRSEAAGSDRSLDLSSHSANLFKHLKMNRQNLNAMVGPTQTHQALQQIYESTLSTIIENSTHTELPLDLSVETSSEASEKRNNRKSTDPRHILRMPKTNKIKRSISEQTEPEDLSLHSPRFESPLLSEEDFDDLDDAEALNRKQQQHANNQIR